MRRNWRYKRSSEFVITLPGPVDNGFLCDHGERDSRDHIPVDNGFLCDHIERVLCDHIERVETVLCDHIERENGVLCDHLDDQQISYKQSFTNNARATETSEPTQPQHHNLIDEQPTPKQAHPNHAQLQNSTPTPAQWIKQLDPQLQPTHTLTNAAQQAINNRITPNQARTPGQNTALTAHTLTNRITQLVNEQTQKANAATATHNRKQQQLQDRAEHDQRRYYKLPKGDTLTQRLANLLHSAPCPTTTTTAPGANSAEPSENKPQPTTNPAPSAEEKSNTPATKTEPSKWEQVATHGDTQPTTKHQSVKAATPSPPTPKNSNPRTGNATTNKGTPSQRKHAQRNKPRHRATTRTATNAANTRDPRTLSATLNERRTRNGHAA
jgi:hypothetical protein